MLLSSNHHLNLHRKFLNVEFCKILLISSRVRLPLLELSLSSELLVIKYSSNSEHFSRIHSRLPATLSNFPSRINLYILMMEFDNNWVSFCSRMRLIKTSEAVLSNSSNLPAGTLILSSVFLLLLSSLASAS